MRPWTTRTLHVALLAAGVAALGSTTASASELPGGTPDVAGAPAQIGGALPLALCQPPVPVQGQHMLPCADTNLGAQSPNLVKQGALNVAGTAAGLGGQLSDGQPLTGPQRVPQTVGLAARQLNRLVAMDHQRPDVALGLAPGNTGSIDQGTLLGGTVRPHQAGAPGFSALDTALNLDAVHGETLKPIDNPSRALPDLTSTPQALTDNLARGGTLPASTDLPGQSTVSQLQQQLGQGLPGGTPVFGPVQGLSAPKSASPLGGLPQLPLAQNNASGFSATGTPVDQVIGQVAGLTNDAGKHRVMESAGRHRLADPRDSGPLNQLPIVGQLAPQLNTPVSGGGNPLSSVGAPVNTGNAGLPSAANPTQALSDPTQLTGMLTGLVTGIAGSH